MSNVAVVRKLLEQRYPDAAPLTQRTAPAVATGIASLDKSLPGSGLPRGKLTAWRSEGGGAAVLRMACQAVIAGGERAAWVDSVGVFSLEPRETSGSLLVRPTNPRNGLRAAEALLCSGGLALLVLAGADPEGTTAVRLTRAAREGGTALVALARHVSVAHLRISSRFLVNRYHWAPGPFDRPAIPDEAVVEVQVHTLGWNTRAVIKLPIVPYEFRLSPLSALADRRGIEQRVRRPAGR